MTVAIRPLRPDDEGQVTAFAMALVDEGLSTISRRRRPTPSEQRSWLLGRLDSGVFLLGAVADGALVGMLDCTRLPSPHRGHAAEFGMSVRRDWRSQGVGSQLVRGVIGWAASQSGLRRLELRVLANNPRAIALYRGQGFEIEGRSRGAWHVDGVDIDLYHMGRSLAP